MYAPVLFPLLELLHFNLMIIWGPWNGIYNIGISYRVLHSPKYFIVDEGDERGMKQFGTLNFSFTKEEPSLPPFSVSHDSVRKILNWTPADKSHRNPENYIKVKQSLFWSLTGHLCAKQNR